jgi:hypothetical protein
MGQTLGALKMITAASKNIRPSVSPWCIEDDTRDYVIARRNVLAGLWAGRLLGLSNAELTAYAVEVHMADFETEGDNDIVLKVANDLSAGGLLHSEEQVRNKLCGFHREAFVRREPPTETWSVSLAPGHSHHAHARSR